LPRKTLFIEVELLFSFLPVDELFILIIQSLTEMPIHPSKHFECSLPLLQLHHFDSILGCFRFRCHKILLTKRKSISC